MKILRFALFCFLLIVLSRCSDDHLSDEALLEKDKRALVDNLDSDKVSTYKFGKILIRASAEKNTISPEFQSFKTDFERIFKTLVKHDIKHPENLSFLDYISIYRDYKRMQNFIMKTDEDIFPTLSDAFNLLYGDSTTKISYFSGEEKVYVQNVEHAILSTIVVLSEDLGKEVSLYECSMTNPELLLDSEIKTLLQYCRGFLFFENRLLYLSENELTNNINWLNNNKHVELSLTRSFFRWGNLDNNQTHTAFHSFNHLIRGFDRLMMDREIDEKRALEDFEMFLKDANEIGIDNEVIWSIETFLYLKNEDNEKAISSLKKLKKSDLLSDEEKRRIDESIEYVKNRKPGKVLNGFFDKVFLSKLVTKYMFSILSNVNWEKVLKEHNVPHTDKMFETLKRVKKFNSNLLKYTDSDNLNQKASEIKNEGNKIWENAKHALE